MPPLAGERRTNREMTGHKLLELPTDRTGIQALRYGCPYDCESLVVVVTGPDADLVSSEISEWADHVGGSGL
jgi:hypothetical protein